MKDTKSKILIIIISLSSINIFDNNMLQAQMPGYEDIFKDDSHDDIDQIGEYVYPYQWDIYMQALRVMRPFLKIKKYYAIYGERVAYYDRRYSDSEYSEIYDFVVLSEDNKAWHIFPKDLENQNVEDVLNGKIIYEVSTVDPDCWMIPDNILNEVYIKELFQKCDSLSDRYMTQNIPPFQASRTRDFFAIFDRHGQIHAASLINYVRARTYEHRTARDLLNNILYAARGKDKNLKKEILPESLKEQNRYYKYTPPEWISKDRDVKISP